MQIEPKPIELNGRNFILSKFPAVAGREIVTKYPVANMPKLGEYQQSEETMLKLMAFVAVQPATGDPILLTTRALVDNHCGDWETLAQLEWQMLEYNCSFFGNGASFDFFESIVQKAQALISKTLTDLLPQSSAPAVPPSGN